jgi:uncharacterized Fe-S cluster-containing radical SAM superfamily protein
MRRKGRAVDVVGSAVGMSKLAESDIPEIIDLTRYGFTNKTVGAMYGVTPSVVSRIYTGKAWVHVPR